jgi:murein DD-endopeptidase MepM/ murein hydrolase activator NlpD
MNPQSFGEAWEQFRFELSLIGFLASLAILLPLMTAVFADNNSDTRVMSRTVQQTESAEAATNTSNPVRNESPVITSDSVIWPMNGVVTAEFDRPHQPWQHRHTGIDISSGHRAGVTPITPFKKGSVTETVLSNRGLGNYVVIDHGDGLVSLYAHLSRITVRKGQAVVPGNVIGYEGNTGVTTGPHLHFEVILNGKNVNPRNYIRGNP